MGIKVRTIYSAQCNNHT